MKTFARQTRAQSSATEILLNAHFLPHSDTAIGRVCIFGAGVLTTNEKYMAAKTSNVTKKPCRTSDDCRIG